MEMKTLPSELFPGCTFSADGDAGFYDIDSIFKGVSLYLGSETVKSDEAIEKAARFFDNIAEWDMLCREDVFLMAEDEDAEMIREYFSFYMEEAPEVFGENPGELTLEDMVGSLTLCHMGTHDAGIHQRYNVDFTLGYDQLLSVYFDSDYNVDHVAWES